MSTQKPNSERDNSIDLLRGSVVLWMIITHTNAIFYKFDNQGWLGFFTWLGATVCFTTFLFCSGSVYGIKFKDRGDRIPFEKLWQRVAYILSGYYVAAFAVVILSNQSLPSFNEIMRVLFFVEVPIFTEFILTFALVDILIFAFQKYLRISLSKPYILLIVAVVVYVAAAYLYKVDLKIELLNAYKALFVGHEELHRFGLLSYFPVLAIGLAWGYWSHNIKDRRVFLGIAFAIMAAGIYIAEHRLGFGQDRFPPSLLFLAYGVAYAALFLLLSELITRLKPLASSLKYMSRYTFEYYQLHVIVMYTVSILVAGQRFGAIGAAAAAIFVILVVSLLVRLIELRRSKKLT
ncbi:MAG: heparan-alpha-glucosaminide N-acetyltransferase domain-containing protein [Candidatus Dojkabacteria bacterium]|nr:MAG: heparan-alpha-glucosaminide N-acetyltransferase domain-containing protein [Candidatus Dojkabacteria bacterium]